MFLGIDHEVAGCSNTKKDVEGLLLGFWFGFSLLFGWFSSNLVGLLFWFGVVFFYTKSYKISICGTQLGPVPHS